MTTHRNPTQHGWRKSSYSNNGGNCVEIQALSHATLAVRDSTDPTGLSLRFTPAEWNTFTRSIKNTGADGRA
ncbi:MAG: DUF397 domain-containing protein [Streptosporangiaceae bacterium]